MSLYNITNIDETVWVNWQMEDEGTISVMVLNDNEVMTFWLSEAGEEQCKIASLDEILELVNCGEWMHPPVIPYLLYNINNIDELYVRYLDDNEIKQLFVLNKTQVFVQQHGFEVFTGYLLSIEIVLYYLNKCILIPLKQTA